MLTRLKSNWKIVAGIIGTGILILVILGMVAGIKQCSFNSGINKENKEVQNLNAQAVNINAVVANLEVKQIEAQANANAANADVERIRNEVNKSKEISNLAHANTNTIEHGNYNGTSFANANSDRCKAFPDSPDCQ